jgi:hypothetical protein
MNGSLNRKSTVALALGTCLLTAYSLLPSGENKPQTETVSMQTALPARESVQANPAAGRESTIQNGERAHAEPQTLVPGEEIPIVGQFVRVRELRRESGDFSPGPIRNLEFVFRPGILPRRLFDDSRNLIVNYRQLYRNSVGYGAATHFFYYEVVSRDSDGDGLLSQWDRVDVAVSRPDGSGYRVLDRDLEAVLGVEHFAAENILWLEVVEGGGRGSRVYSLPANN